MSSPYTVDSSPPSSPGPGERMEDDDEDVQKTPGSSKEGKREANKKVSWRNDSVRDSREYDERNDSQHSPVHPYSGSTLSTMAGVMHRSPTLYEKNGKRAKFKRHNPNLSINEDEVKHFISRSQLKAFEYGNRGRNEDNYLIDDLTRASTGEGESTEPSLDADDAIWEEAISQIIDVAGHTINLRYFPKYIPTIRSK